MALAACATWPPAPRLVSPAMPIDLRSDTVTRPTAAMREAMALAPVGDDVYGEDETVNALERKAAQMCGREAAVFVPSGTMANQIGIGLWAGRGDEVYAHVDSHILIDEAGGTAALWGAQPRGLHSAGYDLDVEELLEAVPMDASDVHRPVARLLCIENAHTGSGGRVWSGEALARVTGRARELGLRVHMDGARLPNAAVARGCTLAEASAGADSVSFCFSKGLGAPVGSMLVSPPRRSRAAAGCASCSAAACGRPGSSRPRGSTRSSATWRASPTTTHVRARLPSRSTPGASLGGRARRADQHRDGAAATRRAGAGTGRRARRGGPALRRFRPPYPALRDAPRHRRQGRSDGGGDHRPRANLRPDARRDPPYLRGGSRPLLLRQRVR